MKALLAASCQLEIMERTGPAGWRRAFLTFAFALALLVIFSVALRRYRIENVALQRVRFHGPLSDPLSAPG